MDWFVAIFKNNDNKMSIDIKGFLIILLSILYRISASKEYSVIESIKKLLELFGSES